MGLSCAYVRDFHYGCSWLLSEWLWALGLLCNSTWAALYKTLTTFFFQQVHLVAEILHSDWNNHFVLSFSPGYITSAEQCFKRSSLWLLAPKTILRDHTKGSACCCMFLQTSKLCFKCVIIYSCFSKLLQLFPIYRQMLVLVNASTVWKSTCLRLVIPHISQ